MANLFSNPSHKANIGYNGFDLSFVNKFSSTVGELLPIFYDIAQPGDKYQISTQLKTRTMPLASAAMVNITEHVEYFFVPMEQIYKPFGSVFYSIDDIRTSLIPSSSGISESLPYLSSSEAFNFLDLYAWSVDMFGINSGGRLCDMLNFGFNYCIDMSISPVSFSPILLCAYQKIFNDFYRLEDRISPVRKSYNLDKFYSSPQISAREFDENEYTMLRYRPRRKNFFTNLFVSPLYNTEGNSGFGSQNDLGRYFSNWLVNTSHYLGTPSGDITSPQTVDKSTTIYPEAVASPDINHAISDLQRALSPSAIRSSFALQKLLEVTRRAAKTYDAQTLAHFGVSVPNRIDGNVYYLGANHSELNIGDVIATATGSAGTSTSVLGQVGGKGYGFSDGEKVSFTCPCHGIIMAIYSAEVTPTYSNVFCDKLNRMQNMDSWFRPEFDNLGMQPLFGYQCYIEDNDTDNNLVMGWQYRFSEFKVKYDQVHGALGYNGTLHYWTNSVTANNDLRDFYCSPSDLDDIMLVAYSPKPSSSSSLYSTDPLIHQAYIDCKKASKMNVYSLENL